jgi:hypothetical protein
MRNELIGLLSVTLLAATMGVASCADYGASNDATGGTGAGTGGAVGTSGGATGTGGSTSGGATGTGGAGEDPITTLSGTTTLSALTADQATQLCTDSYAYYYFTGITKETVCKWRGLSYATSSSAPTVEKLRSNCTSKEDPCLADPAAAVASNPGCSSFPANCAATVAEYSTCIKALATSFTATVAAIEECAVLTNGDAGTGAVFAAQGATSPASCTFPTCSGLYPPNPLFF